MTTAEVMAERERRGWVSPLMPLEPGDFWVMYDSRGTYEVMVHPNDAQRLLFQGVVLDGEWFQVWKVDEHVLMNGVVLRFQRPLQQEFVEAVAA